MIADPTTPEALVEGRRLLNLLMIAEIAHSKDPACMGEWFGWLIRNGEALLKSAEDRQWWERLAVQRGSEIDSALRRAEIAERDLDKVVDQRNEAWNSEGDHRERAEKAEVLLEQYRAEGRRAVDDVRCPKCGLRYGERDQYSCVENAPHEYSDEELLDAAFGGDHG